MCIRDSFRLTSRLGVVLAGGGFSRNMEMMRLYAPGLSDVLPALDEGADGSLIQAAADIGAALVLSLIHISEPTRRTPISYAVFCLKKKKSTNILR